MVSQAFRFLSQFPILVPPNYHWLFAFDCYTTSKTRRWRWRSFSGGGSQWEWDENVNPKKQSRFRDAYVMDDYGEEEVEFGFTNGAKQRRWWSDEFDAEDDEEEDNIDDGLGILEASMGFNWVQKVFQAFGWMIPAVVISMVLGTGQDSMVMASVLPLLQSALSFVAEALWGRSEEPLRTKTKRKRRPSTGPPGRARVRKERENRNQIRRGSGDYKSWVDSNNVSAKMGPQDFGGWDELDNHVREADKEARAMREKNEASKQERAKFSRRVKGGDTPLFARLLIAMFPFLGFWTKLF